MSRPCTRVTLSLIALTAQLAACSNGPPPPSPESLDTPELGRVELYRPRQTPTSFAFLFSAEQGLGTHDRQAAARLAGKGAAVLALDTGRYLRRLNATHDGCVYLPGPLEAVSRRVQRELELGQYLEPLLLGRGQGGALVYATLTQAPELSFKGGLSVDFAPRLDLERQLCSGSAPAPGGDVGVRLVPSQPARGAWQIAASEGEPSSEARAFTEAARASGTKLLASPAPAPLAQLYEGALEAAGTARHSARPADLPLVELPTRQPGDLFAVLYSGDGGWRDLDRTLAGVLAEKGIPVVGVDALRYFWSARTPEQTARDLARILAYYRSAWGRPRVLLIGYSFGADVLPFAYPVLPAELQKAVAMLVLLAPGRAADFEVHLSGWIGSGTTASALPLPPQLASSKSSSTVRSF